MTRTLIEGGLVIPADGSRESWREGWVLIEDGRIAAMGRGKASVDGEVRRIDASRHAVMPGLIDAHTHLGPTGLFRGFAEDLTEHEFLSLVTPILDTAVMPDDMRAAARLAAVECLKAGTTATTELGLDMEPVAEAVSEVGIRCSLGPDVSDITAFHDYVQGTMSFDPAVGERSIEAFEETFKRWHGGADGRITVRITNFSVVACSPDLLKQTRAIANERGIGIDVHVLSGETSAERGRKHFGKETMLALAELGYLGSDVSLVHLIHVTDDEIAAVAESGAVMVQCPLAYAKAGLSAPVTNIRNAGVPIAVGSD